MVIDNALHTSIIIVWQPSFNWSRVCLHTYPINRYCFSSSRDVVFEIFHASHCHYILLKKIIPQNNMFIFGEDQFCSKETWLFEVDLIWVHRWLFGELEDCTHIGWCTQSSSNLKSYNILWCCSFLVTFSPIITSVFDIISYLSAHTLCVKNHHADKLLA